MADKSSPNSSLSEFLDWKLFRKYWYLVGLSTLFAVSLAVAYLAVTKPIYEAQVRIVVQNLGLGLESTNLAKTYDKEFLATQSEVIRSPATLTRSLEELPEPTDPAKPKSQSEQVGAIAEALRVNPLAKTDIIKLTYQHSDPQQATARLESIINCYQNHLRELEKSSASRSVVLLEQRKAELEQDIAQLQQDLKMISTNTYSESPEVDTQSNSIMEVLTRRLIEIQSEIASLTVQLDLLQESRDSGRSQVHSTDSIVLKEVERNLNAGRTDLAEASQIYGPSHPQRLSIEERVRMLESAHTSESAVLQVELQASLNRFQKEEESLRELIRAENQRLKTAHTIQGDEVQIQAKLAQVSELHASIAETLQSMKLANQSLANGDGSIVVSLLDEFVVPRESIWPKPVPVLVISIVMGIMAGVACLLCLAAYSQNSPKTSIDNRAQADDSVQADLLGQIHALRREIQDMKNPAEQSTRQKTFAGEEQG
ncbi:MAG TPA: hypothetical protein DD473_12450 [Planctomycetaceae bacterium]|nr:hypothetical protein [Planctomycetaceae bacterium]